MSQNSMSELNAAVIDFKREYWHAGSNIQSVDAFGNSVRVVVTQEALATALPISYQGYNVAVFLHTGKAGLKLLLRDRFSNIIGAGV